jgi:hypothetical protein
MQQLKGLLQDAIIDDPTSGVSTRSFMINQIGNIAFISKLKPKNNDEALS